MPIYIEYRHDITKFASQDETRYAICGVHYRPDKQILEATNGRILMQVPVGGESEEFLLGVEDMRTMLKLPKHAPIGKALAPIEIEADKTGAITGKRGRIKIQTEQHIKEPSKPYPKTDSVQPTSLAIGQFKLNSRYLALLSEYAAKHGDGDKAVTFKYRGEQEGVEFEIVLRDQRGIARGILMSMK